MRFSATSTVGAASTYYIRDPRGGLLGEEVANSDASYFYLTDAIGSVVEMTDSRGTNVASYAYDPFGQLTTMSGLQAATNPWRFAGQYEDGTGLYKMGQRYYDPSLGRWTQQDALVELLNPLQWNRYAYAGNDPVSLVDASGLVATSGGGGSQSNCMSGISIEAAFGAGLIIIADVVFVGLPLVVSFLIGGIPLAVATATALFGNPLYDLSELAVNALGIGLIVQGQGGQCNA